MAREEKCVLAMKKKYKNRRVTSTILLLLLVIALLGGCSKGKTIVTESTLEKAVEVSDLSVAEYNYNGVYEHLKKDSDKVDYRIKYDATVKVGINMGDIKFTIDEENQTVTPILPELTVNDVIVDTESLGYMPENAKVEVNDAIKYCKQDVQAEAGESDQLNEVAKENLQTVVEALIKPLLDAAGYTIKWDAA